MPRFRTEGTLKENAALTPELSVVCDVGDCLLAALDLRAHERTGELIGSIDGYRVQTEDELAEALLQAQATIGRPSLINVHLQAGDASPAMCRLAEHLGGRVHG